MLSTLHLQGDQIRETFLKGLSSTFSESGCLFNLRISDINVAFVCNGCAVHRSR